MPPEECQPLSCKGFAAAFTALAMLGAALYCGFSEMTRPGSVSEPVKAAVQKLRP